MTPRIVVLLCFITFSFGCAGIERRIPENVMKGSARERFEYYTNHQARIVKGHYFWGQQEVTKAELKDLIYEHGDMSSRDAVSMSRLPMGLVHGTAILAGATLAAVGAIGRDYGNGGAAILGVLVGGPSLVFWLTSLPGYENIYNQELRQALRFYLPPRFVQFFSSSSSQVDLKEAQQKSLLSPAEFFSANWIDHRPKGIFESNDPPCFINGIETDETTVWRLLLKFGYEVKGPLRAAVWRFNGDLFKEMLGAVNLEIDRKILGESGN